jgi:hypothetical protein
MATKDQTRANRANARHSTGPRTADGKAKSSRNALKHGLRAQNPVLPDENAEDFHVLVGELEDQFQPQTAIEWTLLRQLADAEWRMRRVPCLEAGLIAAKLNESLRYYDQFPERLPDDDAEADMVVIGAAAASDANNGDTFSKLSRYEARLSHRYFKALEHLQQIQSLRNRPAEPEPEPALQSHPSPHPPQPHNDHGKPLHPPPATQPQPKQSPATRQAAGQANPASRKPSANQKHRRPTRIAPRMRPSKPNQPRQTNPISTTSGPPAPRGASSLSLCRPNSARFVRAVWDTGA